MTGRPTPRAIWVFAGVFALGAALVWLAEDRLDATLDLEVPLVAGLLGLGVGALAAHRTLPAAGWRARLSNVAFGAVAVSVAAGSGCFAVDHGLSRPGTEVLVVPVTGEVDLVAVGTRLIVGPAERPWLLDPARAPGCRPGGSVSLRVRRTALGRRWIEGVACVER